MFPEIVIIAAARKKKVPSTVLAIHFHTLDTFSYPLLISLNQGLNSLNRIQGHGVDTNTNAMYDQRNDTENQQHRCNDKNIRVDRIHHTTCDVVTQHEGTFDGMISVQAFGTGDVGSAEIRDLVMFGRAYEKRLALHTARSSTRHFARSCNAVGLASGHKLNSVTQSIRY